MTKMPIHHLLAPQQNVLILSVPNALMTLGLEDDYFSYTNQIQRGLFLNYLLIIIFQFEF